jgi:uncharacterized protein YyaL (SSP411 family)
MLHALDFHLEEPRRAVVVGKNDSAGFQKLLGAAHSIYQPNKIISGNSGPVGEFVKSLPAKNEAVVYLCTGNACQSPTDEIARVKDLLK